MSTLDLDKIITINPTDPVLYNGSELFTKILFIAGASTNSDYSLNSIGNISGQYYNGVFMASGNFDSLFVGDNSLKNTYSAGGGANYIRIISQDVIPNGKKINSFSFPLLQQATYAGNDSSSNKLTINVVTIKTNGTRTLLGTIISDIACMGSNPGFTNIDKVWTVVIPGGHTFDGDEYLGLELNLVAVDGTGANMFLNTGPGQNGTVTIY